MTASMVTTVGRRWLRRYGWAELAGLIGALIFANAARLAGHSAFTAFAGDAGEGVGFYAVMWGREWGAQARAQHRARSVMAALLVEFGLAELLDSALIRPGAMYLGTLLTGSVTIGVVLGKVTADVAFYIIAGLSLTLARRRRLPISDRIEISEPATRI